VARALAKGARIILADEPVASLDPESSRRVMQILTNLTTQFGMTLVVSLHQTDIAIRYCTRAIALRHGELVFDGPTDALTEERLLQLYGMQVSELIDARDVAANALLSSTEVAA
jgi:phosphonate transport system ATP-binding protein